ncbi:MAG: protein kinase [Deltaproteobacteria bacterium]|nr:protein kinase [Deltaproteobacteria bacterium]
MSALELAPGTILVDKYRIERVLGKGGMGIVVLATHVDLQDRFAIKILHGTEVDADSRARFLREARAAAQVKNEHIARVVDVGELPSGVPYMVMEFLEGTDLGALLTERGKLESAEAIDLVLQACVGLAEAHARQVVHRDIKPANLFVTMTSDGRRLVKLLDFGISKVNADVALTSTRAVLGTPAYMAPEQWRSAKEADARSDIWSLGVVLHELLSGTRPFAGDTMAEMCSAVMADDPVPLAIGKPALEKVVRHCLEKEPVDRYQRVPELARDLVPFASDPDAAKQLVDRMDRVAGRPSAPMLARPATAPTQIDDTHRAPVPSPAAKPALVTHSSSRRWMWLALGGLAVAIGVAAFAMSRSRSSAPQPDAGVVASPASHRGGVLRVAMRRNDETKTALYSDTASRTQTALRMVVERLVSLGPNGEDRESVLLPIEASAQSTTLVLRLRDGVTFHEGPCAKAAPATAEDVAFSINLAARYGFLELAVGKVEIKGSEVWLSLLAPAAEYKQALSNVRLVRANIRDCESDFPSLAHPIGTGPFQIGKDTQHKRVLVRAPSYWRKTASGERLPAVDSIELVRASDETLAAMHRKASEPDAVHILMLTDAEVPKYVDFTKQPPALIDTASGLELATRTGRNRMGLWHLEPTKKLGPLGSKDVRRAIALAIDRAAVVAVEDKTSRSPAIPTGRILQPNIAGFSAALPELGADAKSARDEARRLIAAMKANGKLSKLVLGWSHDPAAANMVAKSLRELGLEVELHQVTANRMVEERKGATFDALFVSQWLEVHGDEVVGLGALVGDRASEDLAEKIRTVGHPDRSTRAAAYAAIEKQMLDELPVIPIARFDPNRITFGVIVHPAVEGFHDRRSRYVPLELDLDFSETSLRE